jgi:hypothetical protein
MGLGRNKENKADQQRMKKLLNTGSRKLKKGKNEKQEEKNIMRRAGYTG